MNDNRHKICLARLLAKLGCTLAPLLTTGCLAIAVTERTAFEEEERVPIRFASAQAANDFSAGLKLSDRKAYTDESTFVMPFLVARRNELYHRTEHHNAEARRADVDGDGEITELEAREYRARIDAGGR